MIKFILEYMQQVLLDKKLDSVYIMLTDILSEETELLCKGDGAEKMVENAYQLKPENGSVLLKGVVSRKKQLIPSFITALQQE